MPRRRRLSKRSGGLTLAQELELVLGPHPGVGGALSAFGSEAERRVAWFAHRGSLRAGVQGEPWAYWRYEQLPPAPEPTLRPVAPGEAA